MKNLVIDGREIGDGQPPYLIAEMSANHNGQINDAFRIIQMAKDAGADAVKLQTYRADTITLNCTTEDFQIREGKWAGRTLYELYDWAHTPWDWHEELFQHARSLGITMFSSPFDSTAVDLLEELHAPAYKIASFEAIDLPLIRYVASKKKPMIISTGMTNANEIEDAVQTAREAGCEELAVLLCVSGYPAPAHDYCLKTLSDMKSRFGVVVGLSDHTLDNTTAIASVALGASVIEKHFTLDRERGGPDDSFSLEPSEFRKLCDASRTAFNAIGTVNYEKKQSELGNVQFRRSLYFVQDLRAGDTITENSVRSVRPGFGIAPKYFDIIVGSKLSKNVSYGDPVRPDVLEIQLP